MTSPSPTQRVMVAPAPTRNGAPASLGAGAFVRPDTSEVDRSIGGSIDSIRQEIDDAYADIKTFANREPDHCIRMASGHYARMGEIRNRIIRAEDYQRQWKPVREREVEPLMKEISVQWEMASRRHTIRIDEYKIETGDTR